LAKTVILCGKLFDDLSDNSSESASGERIGLFVEIARAAPAV
jgi:hypothetical protein